MSEHTYETFLDLAEQARARSEHDEALDSYKKALMLLGPDDVLERASIYASIGDVKRAQGRSREAELNYEKALSAMPGYTPALKALVEIAEAEGDHRRAVERRKKLAERITVPIDKAAELARAAMVLDDKLGDARGAIDLFEQSRELAPGDVKVLERLRVLYEKVHRWPKVVEILGALCIETDDPVARASLRFAQADIALGRLRDEPRGLSFLEGALEEDPTHEKAFGALVAVRTNRGEWMELQRVYARLIDRYAERGDVARAHDVCKRLGILRRDKLGDGPGAIEAFRGALQCKASDVDTRAALAELLIAKGDTEGAIVELEACARDAPTRAQTYRRLFETLQKNNQPDRAFLCAIALDELGVAEIDHQLVIEQFASNAVKPTSKLDDEAWDELRAPGTDPVILSVIGAVRDSAIRARVADLREQKKLFLLDPTKRQDPNTSTATLVRGVVWAATVLDVPVPSIYVLDDVPGGLAAAQVDEPTLAVGPSVLSGLSLAELAFVCGRHLTYYRPEHYPLVFFPTLPELTSLFLAAIKTARPKTPVPKDKALDRLCAHFERDLSEESKRSLEAAVEEFEAKGGRVDLGAWIRSVELTAQRAGMLLLGDPSIALARVKNEHRTIADVKPEERRDDLLAFLASKAAGNLRKKLGVGIKPSIRPPAQAAST